MAKIASKQVDVVATFLTGRYQGCTEREANFDWAVFKVKYNEETRAVTRCEYLFYRDNTKPTIKNVQFKNEFI